MADSGGDSGGNSPVSQPISQLQASSGHFCASTQKLT